MKHPVKTGERIQKSKGTEVYMPWEDKLQLSGEVGLQGVGLGRLMHTVIGAGDE